MNLMTAAVYADEITWQDNTENGRIEKNSTDEKQPAEEIGRASVGKECSERCRSRWSPYH